MSDGNINRNLLPYNDFQSGYRMGATRAKNAALEAVRQLLHEQTHLNEKARQLFLQQLRIILEKI